MLAWPRMIGQGLVENYFMFKVISDPMACFGGVMCKRFGK